MHNYATFFAFNYIFTPLLGYSDLIRVSAITSFCRLHLLFDFRWKPFSRVRESEKKKEKWITNKRLLSFYYYFPFFLYIMCGYQNKILSTSPPGGALTKFSAIHFVGEQRRHWGANFNKFYSIIFFLCTAC